MASDEAHAAVSDQRQRSPLHATADTRMEGSAPSNVFRKLSIQDRLLTPIILICMILGVVIGNFAPNVQSAFDTVRLKSVSVPIAIGLLVMMWPVLTKIQYECLPALFSSRKIYIHLIISLFLNWIVGPLIMLGLAWATLPDLPSYRTGVILVGLARCIAMVMIWNEIARGNREFCAVLVVINSVLQIVLYSPYAVLFVNIIGGGQGDGAIKLHYGDVAVSVLIYLGIPLVAGVITRYTVWYFTSRSFLYEKFLPWFSPLALIGLLYTIIVMFAYQGKNIVHNLGPVFRVFVPMILYFIVMWTSAFAFVFWLHKRETKKSLKSNRAQSKRSKSFAYDMAVVQAFTAGSNNFELAIAIAIATYGVGSDQALAATIGPLVEVPVLLALTWVALWLGGKIYRHDVYEQEDGHYSGRVAGYVEPEKEKEGDSAGSSATNQEV